MTDGSGEIRYVGQVDRTRLQVRIESNRDVGRGGVQRDGVGTKAVVTTAGVDEACISDVELSRSARNTRITVEQAVLHVETTAGRDRGATEHPAATLFLHDAALHLQIVKMLRSRA